MDFRLYFCLGNACLINRHICCTINLVISSYVEDKLVGVIGKEFLPGSGFLYRASPGLLLRFWLYAPSHARPRIRIDPCERLACECGTSTSWHAANEAFCTPRYRFSHGCKRHRAERFSKRGGRSSVSLTLSDFFHSFARHSGV